MFLLLRKSKIKFLFILIVFSFVSCSKKQSQKNITISDNWIFASEEDSVWLPAKVPGTVHTDLIDNKIIEDPFFRLNEQEVQWIDKKEWRYKTNINIDLETFNSRNIFLEFKGLDSYSDIFLNNSLLLKTDNMFRSYILDIKNYVDLGNNKLEIVFESPIKKGLEKKRKFRL